jgi:hypothetical protein
VQRKVYCRATTSKLADEFRRQTMKSPLGSFFVFLPRFPSARIEFGTWPKLAEQQNQRPEFEDEVTNGPCIVKSEFAAMATFAN